MREERKGLSKASLRGLRTKQRLEVMRAAAASQSVRVVPANDDVRRLMKHPHGGGFPESGGASWPLDRFTKRRLADGSVTRDQPPPEEERREPDKPEPQQDKTNHAA